MIKTSNFPGKSLLSRLSVSSDASPIDESDWEFVRSYSENDVERSGQENESVEGRVQTIYTKSNEAGNKLKPLVSTRDTSEKLQEVVVSARATDSTRILKFNKALSTQTGAKVLMVGAGGKPLLFPASMAFTSGLTKQKADYLKYKAENRIVLDGVTAKLLGCHGRLSARKLGHAFLMSTTVTA